MENKIENLVSQLQLKEKHAKKRALIFTFVPVIFAVFLISYTSWQVTISSRKLASIAKETDSIKKLRDKFQIEYLEAKGFDNTTKNALLNESIKADDLLSKINLEALNKSIIIKYYRKSIDQEKVWLSIKELGYKNIYDQKSVNPVLIEKETNAVAFGPDVPLFDIKVITLTLIRAGFKIQHFDLSKKLNTIQIIRIAPADGSPDISKNITTAELLNIKSVEELIKLNCNDCK